MVIHTDDDAELLRRYFHDIEDSQPLSREREVYLAARITEGDMEARDELVQANLRFVITVAKHYLHRGLPLSDLIGAGNVGLVTAAERFDGSRGFKFISYAVWWVRQAMQQALAEQTRTVHLPENRRAQLQEIFHISRRLEQEREGPPDAEAIAAELDVSTDEVLATLGRASAVVSLDRTGGADDGFCLLTLVADADQTSPDADVVRDSAEEAVERTLTHLDEREQFILRCYYGLDREGPLTLDQIGAMLGVTREWTRQIKMQALRKLRDYSRSQADQWDNALAATLAFSRERCRDTR